MQYRVQEGSLTLDGNWHDRSVNMFLPAGTPVEGVSVVLARDRLPAGQGPAGYATRQRQTFEKELKGFSLLRNTPGIIDGRQAHFLEFNWVADNSTLYQAYVSIFDNDTVLNFTASIPGTADNIDLRKALMKTICSFKFAASPEGRTA